MSQADKEKWDARYRDGAYATRNYPSPFLVQALNLIGTLPVNGRALDLACGAGRNAMYLASCGYQVDAVDISETALALGADMARQAGLSSIRWHAHDLDGPLPGTLNGFHLISVLRYLNLSIIPSLVERLIPGAFLIVEVHLQSDEAVSGPGGTRFRAAPGELRESASNLEVIEYFEGLVDEPDGSRAAVARLIGQSKAD
ncbi:class I SAM-dependent methyltransferase [Pseudohongiella sp. O18]|uniref:class I SAM-dependent methyltransferase n=1 Tax=Pseudohongiella sp. O18 TaxID=2904248 RepID=UPI001F242BFD|nr:methyltransferase domain-containing protein [Pseudohongiella sp. O18]